MSKMTEKDLWEKLWNASFDDKWYTVSIAVDDHAHEFLNHDFDNPELNLVFAAYHGDLNRVKEALEKKPDMIKSYYSSFWAHCALLIAGSEGHLNTVKYLHENGVNITALENKAMVLAMETFQLPVVEYLVENGGDVNADPYHGVLSASRYDDMRILKYLVENGAELMGTNKSPLSDAASGGSLEVFKYIEAYLEEKDPEGMAWNRKMALCKAAGRGHIPIMDYLYDKGVEINYDELQRGFTLWDIIKEGHVDVLEILHEKGVNILENTQWALENAIEKNQLGSFKFLLKIGADLNVKNNDIAVRLSFKHYFGKDDYLMLRCFIENNKDPEALKRISKLEERLKKLEELEKDEKQEQQRIKSIHDNLIEQARSGLGINAFRGEVPNAEGETGLTFMANIEKFDKVVDICLSTLQVEDLLKEDGNGDSVISILNNKRNMKDIKNPHIWAGRKHEFIRLWPHIPARSKNHKELAPFFKKIDIATLHSRGRNQKEPRI